MRRIFFIAAVVVFLAVGTAFSVSAKTLPNFEAPFEHVKGDVVVFDLSSVIQKMVPEKYMEFFMSLGPLHEMSWTITRIDSGYNFNYIYYLQSKEDKNIWMLVRRKAGISAICVLNFKSYTVKAVKKGGIISESFDQGIPIAKMRAFFPNNEETLFLVTGVQRLQFSGKF